MCELLKAVIQDLTEVTEEKMERVPELRAYLEDLEAERREANKKDSY